MSGLTVHRYGKSITPHLILPVVIRLVKPDKIIDDMGHVVPWESPFFTETAGVVFFRHLHRRTLKGQTNAWLAAALSAIERTYPWTYPQWPFVTETEGSINDLVNLGVSRNHCVRIPPGVDSARFVPGPRAPTSTILYFGGMRDYKRPDDALAVLINLRKLGVDCRLLVVGDGSPLSRLREAARLSGYGDSVSFLGRLSDDDLSRLVPSCHVNLHCSVAEGWGHSILESAAAGVPTAAYRVPGVSDTVIDGETGLLVRDGDVQALSGAALRLIQTSDQWVSRCREHALGLTWDASVDRWELLLESLG